MSWLSKVMGTRGGKSADVAAQRLQLVLKYDRAKLPPGLIDTLKDELLAVISRYVDVVEDGIEVSLTGEARGTGAPMVLVANVPIRGPREAVRSRR